MTIMIAIRVRLRLFVENMMKVLARLPHNYYFKWNLNQDQDLTLLINSLNLLIWIISNRNVFLLLLIFVFLFETDSFILKNIIFRRGSRQLNPGWLPIYRLSADIRSELEGVADLISEILIDRLFEPLELYWYSRNCKPRDEFRESVRTVAEVQVSQAARVPGLTSIMMSQIYGASWIFRYAK